MSDSPVVSSLEHLGEILVAHLGSRFDSIDGGPLALAQAIRGAELAGKRVGDPYKRYLEVQVRAPKMGDVIEIREGYDFDLAQIAHGRASDEQRHRGAGTLANRARVRELADARGIPYVAALPAPS